MPADPPRSHARFIASMVVGGALLILFGTLTVRYLVMDLPSLVAQRAMRGAADSAREIAAQVAAAFQIQPKVVVARKTVVEQRSEVLKLVTLEQTLTERQRLDDSWLHSTKTLEVEGDFVIRAGFDLSKPFVIQIEPISGAMRVTLPPTEILATEMRNIRFLHDEDGLWNRVTAADREQMIRELQERVALHARESDIREKARASSEKKLSNLLAKDGRTLTFQHAPAQ